MAGNGKDGPAVGIRRRRRSGAAALAAGVLVAAGCGGATEHHAATDLVPAVAGARTVFTIEDPPVAPDVPQKFLRFLVVEDRNERSSGALLARQIEAMRAGGWRGFSRLGSSGAFGARAPGGGVRARLATAGEALRLDRSAEGFTFYISDDGIAEDGRGVPYYLRRAVRRRIPTIMIELDPLPATR